MRKAIDPQPQQPEVKEPTIAGANKNYGKVPRYIYKYRSEREQQLRQEAINEELKKHPPGTRLMPEDER